MQITSALTPTYAPKAFTVPTRVSVPTATDLVSLSTGVTDSKKQMYRKLEWAGFGIEMVGGGLTLAGHGPIGLSLFAGGAALMVYAGWKRQHA